MRTIVTFCFLSFFCFSNLWAARNIIIFIGDGMGPSQLGALVSYNRARGRRDSAVERMLEQGNIALCMTSPIGSIVTDSAAAGTAIACGKKTIPGFVGIDSHGRPIENLFERAKHRSRSTGVISDIRVTDATPAAFFAHVQKRYFQRKIAEQLLKSGVDVALVGGARYFIPKGEKLRSRFSRIHVGSKRLELSNRVDDRDLVSEAKQAGYVVLSSRAELLSLDYPKTSRLLGLFASDSMPYSIDHGNLEHPLPSLREMTKAAISVLRKNPEGFVLMVEGAKIDWACHANDAASMIFELLDFDEAVAEGLAFAEEVDDTLVVVTADHETGSFGISYRKLPAKMVEYKIDESVTYHPDADYVSPSVFARLERQGASLPLVIEAAKGSPMALIQEMKRRLGVHISKAEALQVLHPETAPQTVWGMGYSQFYPYRISHKSALLGRVLSSKLGIVWSTGTHTATPVNLFAVGPGAETLSGLRDNAWLGRWLHEQLDR